MRGIQRRIFIVCAVFGVALATLPLFSAFEAHIINVTAQIENGCLIRIPDIDFGTTFPQEKLDKTFNVELSGSFIASDEFDALQYRIQQKPKCWNLDNENLIYGEVMEEDSRYICKDTGFEMLPLLCPYLSKHELTTDGTDNGGENDSVGIPAFHGLPGVWDISKTLATEVTGRLVKSGDDISDTWNIDLKVPCFSRHCAQDWEDFVIGINPNANPDDYIQPLENEHKIFGCDLWLEITAKIPPIGCTEVLDLMLVLDRSGSIDATELQTLKDAANAFVTALTPSADGVHVGQTSFSTTGSLDLHLTGVEADAHAAINALLATGFTNLKEGIEFATGELDDAHEHERPAAPDVMVIITDGAPTRPAGTAAASATAAADAARAAGIEVFAVGVGVNAGTETYLKENIADDAAHYFGASDFGDLETILTELAICPND